MLFESDRHGKPAVGIPVTWEALLGTALPVQSVQELIRYAKAKVGVGMYGWSGMWP